MSGIAYVLGVTVQMALGHQQWKAQKVRTKLKGPMEPSPSSRGVLRLDLQALALCPSYLHFMVAKVGG